MMPTSKDVAVAIVAACRETGADPIEVATGGERRNGVQAQKLQAITRARAYAGRAIDKVFNRVERGVQRPSIARMVGANKPSWFSFFSSLDARPLSWWDDEAFKRVVDAVMACEPEPTQEVLYTPPANVSRVEVAVATTVAPYKHGPLPPPKPLAMRIDRGGLRPASDAIRKVLEDDADDRPVFDRGSLADSRPPRWSLPTGKRQMEEDLAQAVRNTAAKTPPPEE